MPRLKEESKVRCQSLVVLLIHVDWFSQNHVKSHDSQKISVFWSNSIDHNIDYQLKCLLIVDGKTNVQSQAVKAKTNSMAWQKLFHQMYTLQAMVMPKLIEVLTFLKCISGPNLEVLTFMSGKLSRRQAQNNVNFGFEVKLGLGD